MKQLHELTIKEVHEGYRNRIFSCVDLVKHFLSRIDKYNPKLNIFLARNQHALEQAAVIDKEIAEKGIDRELLGIPMAIKDNFLTVGISTTASSNILKGYMPQYESTVTGKLLAAGAIFLGKTNMDSFAHGSSTETSDFGPTHNPWNPDKLPGGSSGGSAAAISAQLVTAALGSETAGSIRQPVAWCGVTGFKPTYGRAGRYGCIAMASSTDSPGPIAKTVEDVAIITKVISGKDPFDATTSSLDVENYPSFLGKTDLKGLRIGLVKEYLLPDMRDDVKKLILDSAEKFRSLGATVEEVSLMDPKYAIGVYTVVQRSEVSSNLARFDGIRFGHTRDSFGEETKRRIMLGTYTLSSGYYDAYYKKAQAVRTKMIDQFAEIFKTYDAVIGAVSPGPALSLGATKNQPMFGEMEDILVEQSSVAGLTSAGVPCGFVDGLPIGLQITCDQFQEAKALTIADCYQRNTAFNQFPDIDKTL
ncbi:TPA: Asp-tRNA(Asn)/Glu-tRNA(Gln) amidotransferase subunit GatA [Candidatus Collierbacteria bacterium]|uniref:Glutamyl-tRNA(Gln) amidotransferase subunit A n=1 Tax=Candidatus Collierbacteria bacterium GW2011_GWB2_44_22 TaxID=1618387 RepID=A0A0G1HYA5_9BACT|nr:MAG: Glutamyl-tRNA(Gln) amidotransferase subunit A [Candidatus Collierbacteria bacterium GW2011_GWA2_44_13]KKT52106.1 MAG: Glutamyl-tRNA(Gln) amidotransferase subunit A [Candidatus Collierbacteria bacterium GW2011_GWB2_44_22]KKT63096.1 MAG: Glutamyl-tRNA(Gln) amidotransferase subunit A [Candidatus Collierbacteria bacterium GW2011_GWD1_44_27]KKT66309.1 MAG: Glutamyl-tRNA(Gln) amidotransferase subunit A [Candidatus Collierbacteria bacterium GW2011_GWC2_44_30]KKT68982.1 MAG: glutamyl-tRNA(Gln) 